jgi:hypothetical protein
MSTGSDFKGEMPIWSRSTQVRFGLIFCELLSSYEEQGITVTRRSLSGSTRDKRSHALCVWRAYGNFGYSLLMDLLMQPLWTVFKATKQRPEEIRQKFRCTTYPSTRHGNFHPLCRLLLSEAQQFILQSGLCPKWLFPVQTSEKILRKKTFSGDD